MKYIQYKNIKIINKFQKIEFLKIYYKSLFFSLSLTNYIRGYFYKKLILLFNLSNYSLFKNRCFFNLYSRNTIKKYNLSRFIFKLKASYGFISGVRRL